MAAVSAEASNRVFLVHMAFGRVMTGQTHGPKNAELGRDLPYEEMTLFRFGWHATTHSELKV